MLYILSEKSIATPDGFNVATKEYCPVCLETVYISEELCVKILVVVAPAEEKRGRIYSKGTSSKIALSRYVSILKRRTSA